MKIFDILPEGKENAVSLESLTIVTKLSKRYVRNKIAAERRAGALILSTTEGAGGYYRPSSPEEIKEFVHSMQNRGRAIFAAITAAKAALKGESKTGEA